MLNIFGNGTIVSWKPEPTNRGTWTILSSCIITISLCIWTAVHLNIPEKEVRPRGWQGIMAAVLRHQFWRKVGWFVLGLLAPEMVVFTAWSQWQEARIVLRNVPRPLRQEKSPRWYKKLFRRNEDAKVFKD